MTQPPHPQPNPADGWPPAAPTQGWAEPPRQPGTPGADWPPPPPAAPTAGWGQSAPPYAQPGGSGFAPPYGQPGGPGAASPQAHPGSAPPYQGGSGHGWPATPQQSYPGGAGGGWPVPQQAYPGGGWPQPAGPAQLPPPWQPPAARTAKRIPEDLPFVARPSLRKRGFALGGMTLLIGLVMSCPMGLAASSENGGPDILLAVPLIMLVFALFVGLQLWLVSSGGPVLAVGPDGLWIKTRPTRGQAIWLPWEAIDQIYRRRWGLEKMLCVKPRDPRAGGALGAFTALDAGMQQAFFGTGFTATVNFADRSEEEIVQAVVRFSAGRCRVG